MRSSGWRNNQSAKAEDSPAPRSIPATRQAPSTLRRTSNTGPSSSMRSSDNCNKEAGDKLARSLGRCSTSSPWALRKTKSVTSKEGTKPSEIALS